MNYYPHHIGDYDSHTSHINWLEDAAYSRLLRLYYRTEQPIPAKIEDACRLVRAHSKHERAAVAQVLGEFFRLEADGWHSTRCDTEISKAQAKADRNREVGKLGGRPSRQETHVEPRYNPDGLSKKPTGNPEITLPRTNNQEPITKNKDLAQPPACADKPGAQAASGNGFPAFWQAYPKKRSKGDAEKAWKSLKPDKALQATIIAAVEQAKKRKDWVKDGGEFIPYPATWLRDRGWEDIDLVAVAVQPPKRKPCCWVDAHGAPCTAEAVGSVSGKGYCQNDAHRDFAFYGKKGKP